MKRIDNVLTISKQNVSKLFSTGQLSKKSISSISSYKFQPQRISRACPMDWVLPRLSTPFMYNQKVINKIYRSGCDFTKNV